MAEMSKVSEMPDVAETSQIKTLTLSATLAYNGAPFCGFACQPGLLTVQGELESALALLFKREVLTTCAGRTDTGVHARTQVVSFDIDVDELRARTFPNICRSLNALTDDGISVREVREREGGFSARLDAKMREYRYFVCVDPAAPIFMRDFAWHVNKPLDISAMQQAASYLIGEHDFKSFCLAASAEGKRTFRNVSEISFAQEFVMGEQMLVITVKGNAFLHSMVRAIVGSLVMVGCGKRTPEWMQEVLAAKNRSAAGENAPACGLVLWDVVY
jgi:tRNA pseudouridine38-40 synthase